MLVTDASSPAPSSPDVAAPSPIGGISTTTKTDNELDRDLEQVRQWARQAAPAADAKGGDDTVILDVGAVLAITDAFVITSGRNRRQVQTIADEVEERVKANGGPSPMRVEGRHEAEWVLVDYGDFVVHVFLDETRAYYDLERLWSDAPLVAWKPAAAVGAPD
ncbi:MAG TPA: ribosome silencing factor [Acidimicrobiales bacterium]|nr:ribosome silencing factor [Acidimicrobiales bacterium]